MAHGNPNWSDHDHPGTYAANAAPNGASGRTREGTGSKAGR